MTYPADELLARLRARAADPERRTEVRPAASVPEIRQAASTFTLGDLGRMARALQGGEADPEVLARADMFVGKVTHRKARDLPGTATPAQLDAAERRLGVALPPFLRRVYAEIASGGFGPGGGLMTVDAVVSAYAGLRQSSPGPEGCAWPENLLPIVDHASDYTCVDAATGAVIDYDGEQMLEEWDPEDPDTTAAERAWLSCFKAAAPSVESWLAKWVGDPTFEEDLSKRLADLNVAQAREARQRIGALTLAQRREMGLPDIGWEKVVWGGLGLEEGER